MSELETAELIAREAHHGQIRKFTGEDYIEHPKAVVALLPDVDDKIVAWLHDVLEDNPDWTYDRLVAAGISVANAVDVLMLTHWKKHTLYAEYIISLAESGSDRAKRVKLADLTHNMSCKPVNGQKFKKMDKYILAKWIIRHSLGQKK